MEIGNGSLFRCVVGAPDVGDGVSDCHGLRVLSRGLVLRLGAFRMSSPMSAPSRKRKAPKLRKEEGWVIAVRKWWYRRPTDELIPFGFTFSYSRKGAIAKYLAEYDPPKTWAELKAQNGATAVRIQMGAIKR